MGAAGSSNSAPPPASAPSAPLRERSEGTSTFIYGTGESYCPEYTNENIRQRTRTNTFDVGEEPRSQGPSPYATLRNDEWWNQRPSAPSISNLRSPRRDTLLTYAAQMTGWQAAEGHGPSMGQHQEVMEFSRIISQLAMANQQLASAHTATLAHLETLYVELRRERELRRRGATSDVETLDEPLKKRLTSTDDDDDVDDNDDDDERQRLEQRIGRLENLLDENSNTCQIRLRNSRREEERKLRSRLERIENLVKLQEHADKVNENENYSETCRLNDDRRSEDPESSATYTFVVARGRMLDNTDVPELKNQPSNSRTEMDDEGPTESIHRIHSTRTNDEQANNSNSSDGNLHLETTTGREESKVDDEKGRVETAARNEIVRLSEEIERLKAERLEYQCANERLVNDLTEQRTTIEKLTKDYQESLARCEKVELSLQERKVQYDELLEKFDVATKETERLLKDIDTFKLEKDTAEARICSLEEDLEKSLLEKEQIKNVESQKASKLRAQLSEEVADKKKQIKALEDALDEIQRLKETIKTEKTSDDDVLQEDIDSIDPVDVTPEEQSAVRATNIEEFKKELTLKREARQRAIAAVSSEMERLRRELDAEKEAHSETSRVLDLLRSAQPDPQAQPVATGSEGGLRRSRIKEQKPDEHELALKRTEAQRITSILKVSKELQNDIRFQIEKVDDLRYHLETEPDQHRYRIRCLADIANKTREAVFTRERRASELKDHLAQILVRLGDHSFLDMKDDVDLECERQLENITTLKYLYNERLKVLTELKEMAVRELADVKERLDHTLQKYECMEEDLKKADEKIDVQDTEISNLESQLGLTKADCRDLQNQMSLINGLFTQMLLGASSADMDLDRLTQLIQENHDLISDMAREGSTEAAALPKLLLDLVEQVEGSKASQKRADGENSGAECEVEKKEDDLQQEEIAHNLPKVWRVLLELLSCHAEATSTVSVASCSDPNSCYKSVDTPAGPRLVISVSKTYIRLKELILEKKHLEKEMNRMKQLNVHLECKLGEQEKRLSTVSAELSKTWTIVDRMQAQHQQLHTHEQILRYELKQKRKMLQELKQELEYCREKWESARQKNTNTEIEWRSLRREFAARKALAVHDSFNNSGESGFSDGRGDETDEEDNADEGRIRLGPRRRPRKESPRAPSPDTESEQPTDTELSEPKTGSSATEQRTSTPETEAELDEIEICETIPGLEAMNTKPVLSSEGSQESLDPLDQALTNVIQNLIRIDDSSEQDSTSSTIKSSSDNTDITENLDNIDDVEVPRGPGTNLLIKPWDVPLDMDPSNVSGVSELVAIPVSVDVASSSITLDSTRVSETDGESTKTEESPKSSVSHVPTVTSTMSVFSIGPFPPAVTPSTIKSVQFSDPLIVGPSNRLFAPVFGAPTTEPEETTTCRGSHDESRCLEKRSSRSTESVNDSDNVSVDSSSSLETVKEFSPTDVPSSSSSVVETKKPEMVSVAGSSVTEEEKAKVTVKNRTPEEALAAREDRLKRLEEQAEWLMKKMNATSRRGSELSTRLEELHEVYGEPPAPPPMPDILPSSRLGTTLTDLPPQVPESSSAEGSENTEKPVSSGLSDESPADNAP